jgi:hypothetical protein
VAGVAKMSLALDNDHSGTKSSLLHLSVSREAGKINPLKRVPM